MHNRSLTWLVALIFYGALASTPAGAMQASSGVEYAGQWAGTWDGAGAGDFELTLEKGKEGAASGRVAVTTSAEVAMTATFDGGNAKGTWSLRPKGGGAEVAGGAFALSKK